jgi:hypothetical protein
VQIQAQDKAGKAPGPDLQSIQQGDRSQPFRTQPTTEDQARIALLEAQVTALNQQIAELEKHNGKAVRKYNQPQQLKPH